MNKEEKIPDQPSDVVDNLSVKDILDGINSPGQAYEDRKMMKQIIKIVDKKMPISPVDG